jgi:hypothetical protein
MHFPGMIRPLHVERTPQQFDGQRRARQPRRTGDQVTFLHFLALSYQLSAI